MHPCLASTTLQKTDFYSCQENMRRKAQFETTTACHYLISRAKEITGQVTDWSNRLVLI